MSAKFVLSRLALSKPRSVCLVTTAESWHDTPYMYAPGRFTFSREWSGREQIRKRVRGMHGVRKRWSCARLHCETVLNETKGDMRERFLVDLLGEWSGLASFQTFRSHCSKR
jgi:hypothetical protein